MSQWLLNIRVARRHTQHSKLCVWRQYLLTNPRKRDGNDFIHNNVFIPYSLNFRSLKFQLHDMIPATTQVDLLFKLYTKMTTLHSIQDDNIPTCSPRDWDNDSRTANLPLWLVEFCPWCRDENNIPRLVRLHCCPSTLPARCGESWSRVREEQYMWNPVHAFCAKKTITFEPETKWKIHY